MTELTMQRSKRGLALESAAPMFDEDIAAIDPTKRIIVSWRYEDDDTDAQRRGLFFVLDECIKAGVWDGDKTSFLEHLKVELRFGHTQAAGPQFGTEISDLAEQVIAGKGFSVNDVLTLATAIRDAGPRLHWIPNSIAKGAIDGDVLRRFIRRVEWFIAEKFGVDVGQFKARVDEYAGRPQEATLVRENIESQVDSGHLSETRPASSAGHGDNVQDNASTMSKTDLLGHVDPIADLDRRMFTLAMALGEGTTIDAVQRIRTQHEEEFKALAQVSKESMGAIYERAKDRARGRLDDERYGNVVQVAIDLALSKAKESATEKAA